jgi:hypothetical protein
MGRLLHINRVHLNGAWQGPNRVGPKSTIPKVKSGAGLLNLLILRHRSPRQGLRAETPVLASALRAALTAALRWPASGSGNPARENTGERSCRITIFLL